MSIGNSPPDAPSDAPDASSAVPSIGRALAQGRRDAGLTVDAISTATRVRVPIVRAIEEDDFSRCGGDVYARGHIRAFARVVGIDPAPLVAEYDAEHGGRPAPTRVAPLYDSDRIRPEARRPAGGAGAALVERWTRFVLRHRWPVLGAWVAILLVGGTLSAGLSKLLSNEFTVPGTDSEEARSIHLGETEPRPVHGNATAAEAKSLIDEGVPVAPLPLPVVPPNQVN